MASASFIVLRRRYRHDRYVVNLRRVMRIVLFAVLIFMYAHSFAGTQDKYSQCMEGLKSDGRFSSIANHVALDGQGIASRNMLADKARPDEQQKQAIADWIDARSQCVNLGPNPVSVDLHMAFASIVADLYNGQASFGEFNRKWQVLYKQRQQGAAH
ncbi:MAG: hypothetical protein PHT15_01245 [Gallionellaceae bacterium]|nr:hypothetical protein [Gallionellaceae bacterium]